MSANEPKSRKAGSRSPRAPAMALDSAIKKALDLYAAEQLHPVPVSEAAKHLGYKNANNGAALTALAALRYFGLLERPIKGMLNVSSDVERFQYSSNAKERRDILRGWLFKPGVFNELYEQYGESPPSLEIIRDTLIQHGFRSNAASSVAHAYVESLDYIAAEFRDSAKAKSNTVNVDSKTPSIKLTNTDAGFVASEDQVLSEASFGNAEVDTVVVRLSGGRRAWIVLPIEFYGSDKERIKAHIDVIVADDED